MQPQSDIINAVHLFAGPPEKTKGNRLRASKNAGVPSAHLFGGPQPRRGLAGAASTEPTLRQAQILGFITRHHEGNGYAPSVREIMAAFGLKSPNAVACHLKALERKGLIAREKGKGRTLRAVAGPRPELPYLGEVS